MLIIFECESMKVNITLKERRVLAVIRKGVCTIQELSFIFNNSESCIRDHLKSLRKKNLVLGKRNVSDPTRKYFFVSPEAEKIIELLSEYVI